MLRPKFWKKEVNKNIYFDAIVDNPPYKEETGGAGRQVKPIYNHFVGQVKILKSQYVSMITPSRWFSSGMGLDSFRDNMILDNKLMKIKDYINAKDCFPQISISGGVSHFFWSSNYQDYYYVENVHDGKSSIAVRQTNEF